MNNDDDDDDIDKYIDRELSNLYLWEEYLSW